MLPLPTFKNIFFQAYCFSALDATLQVLCQILIFNQEQGQPFPRQKHQLFFGLFLQFFFQSKTFRIFLRHFFFNKCSLLNQLFNNSFCLELKRSQVLLLNKMLCIWNSIFLILKHQRNRYIQYIQKFSLKSFHKKKHNPTF